MSDPANNFGKGFYADKPLLLADRLERMGFYLDEEAAALLRAQHVEIERLRAERDALLEALRQIDGFTMSQFATANDMAYKCVAVASVALYAARKEGKT